MKLGITMLLAFVMIGSQLGTSHLGVCQAQSAEVKTTPAKKQTTVDPAKIQELTFNDLEFEMEKEEKFERSMLTSKIKSYHGKKIRIRGYIKPAFSQSGLKNFIFVRDNKECCFGPGAAIFDNILVKLTKGTETDYTVRPVAIEGLFSLKEYKGPSGTVYSIYRMHKASVK